MICLNCDCELPAERKEAMFPQYWRGCLLSVPAPADICSHCGEAYLRVDGIDELRINTVLVYERYMRFLSLCLSKHPELATFL